MDNATHACGHAGRRAAASPGGRGGGAFQWWEWAGYQVFASVSLVRILDVVTICMTGARRIATGGTNVVSEPART
ncbi:hypothetical protein DU808_25845 [Salmonella enterica subsp. enterica]|uniref:Uncharacterized protein n=4 Tax=Salmonella enterica TaxID=28901 RepID=A0A3Z7QRZ4_SALET|nr:hypothetical protein SEEC0708_27385 [Salmonella enterica subsp. enterica serovar Choleraesuis str. ATCC 10708]EAA9668626.1 hypothetical protein [Salmonella enterica subsp. enterica serovar Infantis]EAC1095869.1 hypothetical protein [Salmonella enterica subsp. enterica serovar Choleraesuis]EAO2819415.1 hypothetical protein [Salmonella enterica]EAW2187785.1 hypothetical protein [Salmonella enterica subsp. enterica]EAW5223186.1 hypothetical protein [Salmonella enterica subsp. enterica serovar 